VNKAISWPLSQESSQATLIKALGAMSAPVSFLTKAPLGGRRVVEAPILLVGFG
jgi:hypothetical protein